MDLRSERKALFIHLICHGVVRLGSSQYARLMFKVRLIFSLRGLRVNRAHLSGPRNLSAHFDQ